MKAEKSLRFMKQNNIEVLVADIGEQKYLTKLLDELGGEGRPIPFYAVFPSDGSAPITFDDIPLTHGRLVEYLEKALEPNPSESVGHLESTVMGTR